LLIYILLYLNALSILYIPVARFENVFLKITNKKPIILKIIIRLLFIMILEN